MGFLGNLFGTSSNFKADTNYLQGQTQGSAANNMALQNMLMQQATGGGPNLADQMNQVAVQRNQAAAGSLLGSVKGMNPAAKTRQIVAAQGQAGADAAGQAVTARMQQQLEAQRLLGVNTMGMTGVGANYYANAQGLNQQTQAQNAQNNQALIGGLLGGAGSAATMGLMPRGKWSGGEIQGMCQGGCAGGCSCGKGMAAGGMVGGPQSELGQYVMAMQGGGYVPGAAPVGGDSPRNDVVGAMLSPGEVVLPRSVAQAPNAPARAAEFVAALKARRGQK